MLQLVTDAEAASLISHEQSWSGYFLQAIKHVCTVRDECAKFNWQLDFASAANSAFTSTSSGIADAVGPSGGWGGG